jgi:hypothetical protein
MIRSYIGRFGVHWRIGGRQSWEATSCGGIDNAKGCKGKECCCEGITIIHRSAIESIASHRGVDNGRSTTKGDGNGETWSISKSKEKMYNLG